MLQWPLERSLIRRSPYVLWRKAFNAEWPMLTISAGATLNLTEPASTGIGGDMFCLYYDAKTKKISALNGSGRSGAHCTLQRIRKDLGMRDGAPGNIPMTSVHAVTIPGAPAGWVDTVEKFGSGKLSLEQILAPAVELGENGFPVHELSSVLVSSLNNPGWEIGP